MTGDLKFRRRFTGGSDNHKANVRQTGNILDGRIVRTATASGSLAPLFEEANLARLIPGAKNGISRKVRQPGVRRWLSAQDVTVATASLCTTFVIGIALRASHSPATLSVLLLAALASSCAMVLGLEVLNSSRRSNGRKNVLVIGEELTRQKALAAIQAVASSPRTVGHAISYSEFEEIRVAGQFNTFARRKFIDEIVISSREANVVNVLREARRQRLARAHFLKSVTILASRVWENFCAATAWTNCLSSGMFSSAT